MWHSIGDYIGIMENRMELLFRVEVLGFWVYEKKMGSGSGVKGLGFGVSVFRGLGFGIPSLGFEGFRVLGYRVLG